MSTAIGRQAEQAAVEYLERLDYVILQRNWRTRWCEIDIVAQKDNRVYFVEVKYRSTDYQGSGLTYITPKKLQQMQFAAEFWLARYGAGSTEYSLGAVEVGGAAFEVSNWIENIV